MSELHLLVVFDTEARTFRMADLNEAPPEREEPVWDALAEEWRGPTFDEEVAYDKAETALSTALAVAAKEVLG